MTEDQLEQETLAWLADVGYQHRHGPELAPEGSTPERSDYRQVLLTGRLRQAINLLNPGVPQAARDDAPKQVVDLGTPSLPAANRQCFSDMLSDVVLRYQNRSIEAAQVTEELVQMARTFRESASRSEELGLTEDEVRFYDALADETLNKIAQELTESLRKNLSVDWSQRESVQAKLRLLVKRILRKYKYPPDKQDAAVEQVLDQAKALADAWA